MHAVNWHSLLTISALKDSSKRSINSDWKIELPGEFELAGTTVRYVRRGLWEKMSAKGPTKTPLHLMVNKLGLTSQPRGATLLFYPANLL